MKLKPCPFCGCTYEKDPDDFFWAGDHEEGCPLSNTFPTSITNITVSDDPDAIELWNKRAPQWVSVKDRLPEGEVLAANFAPDTYGYEEQIIGYVSDAKINPPNWDSGEYYAENDHQILNNVTHWMPLPGNPIK